MAVEQGFEAYTQGFSCGGERVEERAAALAPTRGQQREEGAKGDGLKPQSGQEMRLNSGERGQADGSGSPMEERVEINNRIGGGAGRRLTLAELQVCCNCFSPSGLCLCECAGGGELGQRCLPMFLSSFFFVSSKCGGWVSGGVQVKSLASAGGREQQLLALKLGLC